MTRSIVITPALERIEALGIVAWGFGLLIDVAVFLYCGAKGLSQLLGLDDYRPLVGPMAAIWAILAIHAYPDMLELLRMLHPSVILPYVIIVVLLPCLVLWTAYGLRRLLARGKTP